MATLSRYISWGRNHIATDIVTDIATDIATDTATDIASDFAPTSQPQRNHIATTVANHAAADIAGKASEAGGRRATLVATCSSSNALSFFPRQRAPCRESSAAYVYPELRERHVPQCLS